jgi:hypothetical protein
MACDDEILPLQARIEAITDEADLEEVYNSERHLLYVARTRARDHPHVSGVAPVSEFLADFQELGSHGRSERADTLALGLGLGCVRAPLTRHARGLGRAEQIARAGIERASRTMESKMKTTIFAASLALALAPLVAFSPADAKGCLKGAAVGGVAGHMAGHHGVLGAIGGCVVGHHMANKSNEKSDQNPTASSQPQPQQQPKNNP